MLKKCEDKPEPQSEPDKFKFIRIRRHRNMSGNQTNPKSSKKKTGLGEVRR